MNKPYRDESKPLKKYLIPYPAAEAEFFNLSPRARMEIRRKILKSLSTRIREESCGFR